MGTPCRSVLRAPSGASCTVGGGFVEPFAFGCPAPAGGPDASGRVRVAAPPRPFTLAAATAATSASSTRAAAVAFVPRARHWPLVEGGGEPDREHSFADGGDVENFGLIALLRRRVERVVVVEQRQLPGEDTAQRLELEVAGRLLALFRALLLGDVLLRLDEVGAQHGLQRLDAHVRDASKRPGALPDSPIAARSLNVPIASGKKLSSESM